MLSAVLAAQVLHDSLKYADVVVYGEEDRLCHVYYFALTQHSMTGVGVELQ
jgi:hypothetical protein